MIDNDLEQELDDPIVAEVRTARDTYAKQFNYNIRAMCEDIKRCQAEFEKQGFKFINGQPKLVQPRTGADS